MKRPILGLLAAAVVSLGLLGSPVQAATPSPTAAMAATPSHHDGTDHPQKYSARHPQGGTRHHDHDDDHHHRRGPCTGLIVLFCRA